MFWENLGYNIADRSKRGCITFSITALILIVVFGVNLGLNVLKVTLEDSSRDQDNPGLLWTVRILSILTGLLVVIINVLLARVVRMLTSKEKHSSYTKYHLSVAFKLTSAMFVNSALIPLFVNLGKENWFVSSGLVVDTFYNTISVGFISPLFYIINPVYLIQWIR